MKKMFLPLLALCLALGTVFATQAPHNNSLTTSWFEYDGGDVNAPGSYHQVGSDLGCQDGADICTIQAPVQMIGGEPRPVLDALESEIEQALSNGQSTQNVKLRN
jgi:hypothetical protein